MAKKFKMVDSTTNLTEDTSLNDCVTLDSLNDDCLIQIFKYLPITDRIRLERVNKRWGAISQSSWNSYKKLNVNYVYWVSSNNKTKSERVNNGILEKVLTKCGKYLTHFSINAANKVNEACLESSSEHSLNSDSKFNFDLFKSTPNLKSVSFEWIEFTLEDMQIFVKHCKNIEKVSFCHIESVFNICFDKILEQTIFRAYTNLKAIKFYACHTNNSCLRKISSQNIEQFELSISKSIHPIVIDMISKCQKLKKLCLKSIVQRFKVSDLVLPDCLQHLKIIDNNLNDNDLKSLSKFCPNLLTLDISFNSELTDTGLAYVALLPKLEHLNVSGLYLITGRSFINMPRLKTLSSFMCRNIAPKYIENVLEVSDQLQLLDLTDCSMIDKNFITNVIKYLETRKNGVILTLILGHVDPYSVKLPSNLKLILKPKEEEEEK